MHTLRFDYSMELHFSEPARKHQFTLRMLPCSDERQKILEHKVKVSPECELHYDEDAFGNRYVYGEILGEHEVFRVETTGVAQVTQTYRIPMKESHDFPRYRYPSRYTRLGEQIPEWAMNWLIQPKSDYYAAAEQLLHQIYQEMEYKPGVTDIHTTAGEALAGRQGVCQDYAHIMIALCRMADIPARYIVGMMQGEGFSHAWVEVGIDGYWYGMDPTNNRIVDDTYIKISHGRDYQDCIVNRGVFSCLGTQEQTVRVIVQ